MNRVFVGCAWTGGGLGAEGVKGGEDLGEFSAEIIGRLLRQRFRLLPHSFHRLLQ